MPFETLSALAAFAFVTCITPGPNNLMLMASGANFGFRRTVPHMLGVCIGMPVMLLLVGVGLIQIFERFPVIYTLLKVMAVGYTLFLAWKIAHAAAPRSAESAANPLSFLQAAAFQWVNPKAISMAISALTLFAAGQDLLSILIVSGAFLLSGTMSTTSWAAMGTQIRHLLQRPRTLRIFNIAMATLLIASMIPAVLTS